MGGSQNFPRVPSRRFADPRAPWRDSTSRRCRGLASSWPRGGISPRGLGARPGDYRALPPPPTCIYIPEAAEAGPGRAGPKWQRRGARRAAGAPGGPAPSPSSTSSPVCPRGAPRPGLPARRSQPAAKAPRSPGTRGRPRPRPAPAAAAAAPGGPRSRPPGWVSSRGARAWAVRGHGEVGAERGPPPPPAPRLTTPSPAGARLPWPLRLGPSAPLPLAVSPGSSGAQSGAGGPGPQRRTRRHRTIFSEEQLQALEALFLQNQYPDVGTRERLAGRIRLREERVEVGRACRAAGGPPGSGSRPPLRKSARSGAGAGRGAAGGGAGRPGTPGGEGPAGTGTCREISLELEGR